MTYAGKAMKQKPSQERSPLPFTIQALSTKVREVLEED
jgi:hypothetical protein